MNRSLVALILSLAVPALAQDAVPAWSEVVCPDGGFAASMPGKPARIERSFTLGNEQITEIRYVSAADGNAFYVGYNLWSVTDIGSISPAQVIDAVQADAVAMLGGKIATTEERQIGGFLARVATFSTNDRAAFHLICPIGDRVLQAAVICRVADPSAEALADVHRFFDSLRVLGEEENSE